MDRKKLIEKGRNMHDNLFFDIALLEHKVFALEQLLLKDEQTKKEYYKKVRHRFQSIHANNKERMSDDFVDMIFNQPQDSPFL